MRQRWGGRWLRIVPEWGDERIQPIAERHGDKKTMRERQSVVDMSCCAGWVNRRLTSIMIRRACAKNTCY